MKKNIITLSLILLSVVCFAQEMESKWYAGFSSKINQLSITSKTGEDNRLEIKTVEKAVFMSPYIGRKISKRLDVGVAYALFRSNFLREVTWNGTLTQLEITAHTISCFTRLELIQKKRFSLDLIGFVGRIKQQNEFSHQVFRPKNSFEVVDPWQTAISGRAALGVNYDLGSRWRIRLAKDFLEYGQDDFDGFNEFTFLDKLDSVYFVFEYRF